MLSGRSCWGGWSPFVFCCLIVWFIPVDSVQYLGPLGAPRKQNCEHYVNFIRDLSQNNQSLLRSADDTASSSYYEYVDSSIDCDMELGNNWKSYRQCKESEISLDLYTDTILPMGNVLPYIRVNMSVVSLEPTDGIWFVYDCVHAPDEEDNYCHERKSVLPCRGVRLTNKTEAVPFRVDVLCFKMFSLSHYQIDVVVHPQKCRATMYATIPNERKFDPRIDQFLSSAPQGTMLDYEEWSPFVFVETHPTDGVWVRFEYPVDRSRVLEVTFALYKQTEELSFIRNEVVRLPDTGFKWTDLDAGTYFIYAYIQRAHCRLVCLDRSARKHKNTTPPSCTVCPHTTLNFTISSDKLTPSWQRVRTLIALVKVLVVSILVLLLILAFGLISVLCYLRYLRPRQLLNRPPQNFELVAQPKILILYTDDCQAHSDCVLQLAHFLVANASARVHIDVWDLNDPSVRATNWLINKMLNVDFVLIVFSEASRRVMEGERMFERRPFPDLFNPALKLIVSKITSIVSRAPTLDRSGQNTSSLITKFNTHRQNGSTNYSPSQVQTDEELLKQFVVVYFDYSPKESIAEFFPLMGCHCYCVPEELARLVAHLHRIDVNDEHSHLEFAVDTQALNAAIHVFKEYWAQNPNYLDERFAPNLPHQIGIGQLTGLELANPELPERDQQQTDSEILKLIERYGLENDHTNGIPSPPQVCADETRRRIEESFPLVPDDDHSSDENG